jgi:ribosomal-protein-alanine N-acetyltransferase
MCADSPRSSRDSGVVACREEDLGEVQQLLEASPEAAAWSKQALAELFEQFPLYFLVCFHGEEIAGFICGRRIVDEGEILNLVVKPEFRRQGAGSALAKGLLEVFACESVYKVFLEVRESNVKAIALYQSLGFRQVGKRMGYYQDPEEDAFVLAVTTPSVASTG